MDKDYNIDDILSELKEHREEDKPLPPPEPSISGVTPETEPEKEEAQEQVNNDTDSEQEPDANQKPEPVVTDPSDPEYLPEPVRNERQIKEETGSINIVEASENDEGNIALPDEPEEDEEDEQPYVSKGSKARKIAITVLSILLVLIIGAGLTTYLIANNMLNNLIKNNLNPVATADQPWTGMDKLEEKFDPINETEATELASLQDMIKEWYYNGTPCRSTHVLNVLFIGEDTRGKKILEGGTRADSAIIVSVNIDTKQITLTSVLRDAWAYYETEEGNEDSGTFNKINSAMSTGDINAYINCLEKLYKIEIDNYVIVNFDSFEGIVNVLGGVEIELTSAEIDEINNNPKRYDNVSIKKTFDGDKGKVKLNGKQALAYCRIRKLDSDNKRADRQKSCLIEIFNQSKEASTIKLLKIVNQLIPYVKTSFGKSDIVKIAKYAMTQGWLHFDIYMQNLPENNLKGGTYYKQWIWRPDYPADAYMLQTIIYGKSNITLAHVRPDTANCPDEGFRSEGDIAMYNVIYNNNYGETTKIETTTKEEDSE
ncbi:MAG: LCP family protein [Eubacterium sp.]|nr:LCP family protein [Eubacterium sp.]